MKKIKVLLFSILGVTSIVRGDVAYIPSGPRVVQPYPSGPKAPYVRTSYRPAVPLVRPRPVIRIDYTPLFSKLPYIENELRQIVNGVINPNELQINRLIQETNYALNAIIRIAKANLWTENSAVIENIYSLINYIDIACQIPVGKRFADRLAFPSTFLDMSMQNIRMTLKKTRSLISKILYTIDKSDVSGRLDLLKKLNNSLYYLGTLRSYGLQNQMLMAEINGLIKYAEYAENQSKTTSPYAPETADSFWGSI